MTLGNGPRHRAETNPVLRVVVGAPGAATAGLSVTINGTPYTIALT